MFWQRFYDLCVEAGTKPNPLGDKAGVSSATITQWKQGATPAGDSLIKIADELDCSVDYLLGRTDNPTAHISPAILTTSDIKGDNSSIVNSNNYISGSTDVSIQNGATPEQSATLVKLYNSLDPVKQAKVLVYIDELTQSN